MPPIGKYDCALLPVFLSLEKKKEKKEKKKKKNNIRTLRFS